MSNYITRSVTKRIIAEHTPSLTASIFENGDLLQLILEHLDDPSAVNMLTSSKESFTSAMVLQWWFRRVVELKSVHDGLECEYEVLVGERQGLTDAGNRIHDDEEDWEDHVTYDSDTDETTYTPEFLEYDATTTQQSRILSGVYREIMERLFKIEPERFDNAQKFGKMVDFFKKVFKLIPDFHTSDQLVRLFKLVSSPSISNAVRVVQSQANSAA